MKKSECSILIISSDKNFGNRELTFDTQAKFIKYERQLKKRRKNGKLYPEWISTYMDTCPLCLRRIFQSIQDKDTLEVCMKCHELLNS